VGSTDIGKIITQVAFHKKIVFNHQKGGNGKKGDTKKNLVSETNRTGRRAEQQKTKSLRVLGRDLTKIWRNQDIRIRTLRLSKRHGLAK